MSTEIPARGSWAPTAAWSDDLYAELRRLARRLRVGADATLNTTGLAHEAYLKLIASGHDYVDRNHFLAVAARAMRHIVIDAARQRSRLKRGGDRDRTDLDGNEPQTTSVAQEVIAIHVALERIEAEDPQLVRVVECRFFAGYSDEETALALGVPLRTAQRLWQRARQTLAERLGARPGWA